LIISTPVIVIAAANAVPVTDALSVSAVFVPPVNTSNAVNESGVEPSNTCLFAIVALPKVLALVVSGRK
jgi:hypothetical protein